MNWLDLLYIILAMVVVICIYCISREVIKGEFGIFFIASLILAIVATTAAFVGIGFPKVFTNTITIFSTIVAISELAMFTEKTKEKRKKLSNSILWVGLILFIGLLCLSQDIRTNLSTNDFSPLEVLGFALFLLMTSEKEKKDKQV